MDLANTNHAVPEPDPFASWKGILPVARELVPDPCQEWVVSDANRWHEILRHDQRGSLCYDATPAEELAVWARMNDCEKIPTTHMALRAYTEAHGHYSLGAYTEDLLLERGPFLRAIEQRDRIQPWHTTMVVYCFAKNGAELILGHRYRGVAVGAFMRGGHSAMRELIVAEARAFHEGMAEILAIAGREDVSAISGMFMRAAAQGRG